MPIKNIKKLTLYCTLMILGLKLSAQTPTGLTEDFNDNILDAGWQGNASYVLTESNQELSVAASKTAYATFVYTFSPVDITQFPYLKIRMKASPSVNVRIDLEDANTVATNAFPVIKSVTTSGYTEFTYSFEGKFVQSWPGSGVVDPATISKIIFFFAPGSSYSGSVQIDDIILGSHTGIFPPPEKIRLNQIGFYPSGPKTAIAVDANPGSFYVVSQDKQDTLFEGTLGSANTWAPSGETVRKADFSSFTTPGTYYLALNDLGYSHEFEIKNEVHHEVAKALLKAFYFQRASTALTSTYAGPWARSMGHPDNSVIIHNSAASPLRPQGTTIEASKGWYDAGDYNKYIVNSGISTYTFLKLYEDFSTYYDTVDLHIPESNNNLPDILDEGLWNVRWMLKMQDPNDGGVYHKLSNTNFGGTVMPSAHTSARYVVKKSTSAALNFAAVMAQSARIFSKFPTELPGLADSCINAAVNAWLWARRNPNESYVQSTITAPTFSTGEYGDAIFVDEFNWAGYELYATTQVDSFFTAAGTVGAITIPGWQNVRALGFYSLAHNRKNLTTVCDTQLVKNRVLTLANSFRVEAMSYSAYGVGMTNGYFYWGSNSIAANMGMVNILAFNFTKDSSYYKTAIAQIDYLLGRNATNYSFITGYGDVSPRDLHHRICAADGIEEPVPGLLVGGPNTDSPSDCGSSSYPSTTYKAKAYVDAYCSYSTNEIAINWNAPAAYLLGAMEALQDGAKAEALSFSPVLPTNVLSVNNKKNVVSNLIIYPNPVSSELTIQTGTIRNGKIEIKDLSGMTIKTMEGNFDEYQVIDLKELNQGIYTLILSDEHSVSIQKFVKE